MGKRHIFSMLGFTTAGVIVGRSIWEYLVIYTGLPLTLAVGLALFLFTGLMLHKFREKLN